MKEIRGDAKTIRELLGSKYSIDYYQREYRWEQKQVRELIQDLTTKFQDGYQSNHERKQVASYPHYFLGSIIISDRDKVRYIVDGQQRLTSLTLLLIYLRHQQAGRSGQVNVDDLIYSEQYGEKSFNLHVDERVPCMNALFEGTELDTARESDSVKNLYDRYQDIKDSFPEELTGIPLPFFIDWLRENVHMIVITATSDDDAYTIFETIE